jgi:hypothetical protein
MSRVLGTFGAVPVVVRQRCASAKSASLMARTERLVSTLFCDGVDISSSSWPESFWADREYVFTRWRADPGGSLVAEANRRGFRTDIQGVAMHRPDSTAFNRPDVFLVHDWR